MSEKSISQHSTAIEAMRLFIVVNKPTFNAVDEHVGISGVLLDNKNDTETSTVIQRTANYMGLNEWSLELFVPPGSILQYNACLFVPPKSSVSNFTDTRGLYLPPPVPSFRNHPWLIPPEAPNVQTQEHLNNIIHQEECKLRQLVVADKSLRIDLNYGKDEVKVTEMRSRLNPNGDAVSVRVPLPEDTGFYKPDIRHFIDKEYKDNLIPDNKLCSVKIGAAHDVIYHTIIDPAKESDNDKLEEISRIALTEADRNIPDITITPPPTVGFKTATSATSATSATAATAATSRIWKIVKYGLPVLGLGLAAAFYYRNK